MKGNGHTTADWRFGLHKTTKGAIKPILANAVIAFRTAPDWHSVLHFDLFRQQTMLTGTAPWSRLHEDRQWADIDDIRATNWLQEQGVLVSRSITEQAIELAARDREHHPVLDYVKACRWDADKPLLDQWMIKFLGAADNLFVRAASSKWMISAVARVMQPGCKADCALIMEGPQGKGKSTALRILFHPWFTDDIADLGSKDSAMQLPGAWCLEISELDAMQRSDVSRTKAFMSRNSDRYRPAFGHRVIEWHRQNVFAGTVNRNEYLRDETGGRRFLPVGCARIDLDGLHAVRDALWAEARDRFLADETWWLDQEDVTAAALIEQEARRIIDPWQNEIARLVGLHESVTASEVLSDLNIPLVDRNQLQMNRVSSVLNALGWERRSIRHQGKPVYRWCAPTTEPLP